MKSVTKHNDETFTKTIKAIPFLQAGQLCFANRAIIVVKTDGMLQRFIDEIGRGYVLREVRWSEAGPGMAFVEFTLSPAALGLVVMHPQFEADAPSPPGPMLPSAQKALRVRRPQRKRTWRSWFWRWLRRLRRLPECEILAQYLRRKGRDHG